MNISVSQTGDQAILELEGAVDERGAEDLKQRFRSLPLNQLKSVIIDLGKVTHIGSAGIGKMLVFYKDLAVHDAKLSLIKVPALIYQMFVEMKLDTLFSIARA
ncbi:MAG TPA: STAS domain-containing protein [Candidatus Ozemobacteraceae bacterium]|nr:STAS domain-containing protein [Candidatus Ozemobacteraceae bacterium]